MSSRQQRRAEAREAAKRMQQGGVNPVQLAQADLRRLEMEKAALVRHVEHQRCVMAIMLRRLGGYVAIHEHALANAVRLYDVEVGNRAGLSMPDPEDKQALPEQKPGPIVFRLIDREDGGQVEAHLQALPQRVLDLVEAAEAVLEQSFDPVAVKEVLVDWLAQEAKAQTPEDFIDRLQNAGHDRLDELASAVSDLREHIATTNHEDADADKLEEAKAE